ncbi:hypothetical protein BpHYR1_053327, partial [Brachionus plicatilis]
MKKKDLPIEIKQSMTCTLLDPTLTIFAQAPIINKNSKKIRS